MIKTLLSTLAAVCLISCKDEPQKEVIEGLDIVDQIKMVETHTTSALALTPNKLFDAREFKDVPVEPVIIKSIRRASGTE